MNSSLRGYFRRSRSCRSDRRPETMKCNHEDTKNTRLRRSSILHLRPSVTVWVRVLHVMLPKQVLAVVVPVRSSDDRMDVLTVNRPRVGGASSQAHRQLMIEFDQYYRALDAVIKDAFRFDPSDPGEAGVFNMPPDFVHLQLRVSVAHISDVFPDQVEQLFFLLRRKF